MLKEGHTIGNHTFHHPTCPRLQQRRHFSRELKSVEALYKDITGKSMTRFYRPPQGKYSTENLRWQKTWDIIPSSGVLPTLTGWPTRSHPKKKPLTSFSDGSIRVPSCCCINTSRTNGEILDELLAKWEEMGYTFLHSKSLSRTHENKKRTGLLPSISF